jgi:hypothetical protein
MTLLTVPERTVVDMPGPNYWGDRTIPSPDELRALCSTVHDSADAVYAILVRSTILRGDEGKPYFLKVVDELASLIRLTNWTRPRYEIELVFKLRQSGDDFVLTSPRPLVHLISFIFGAQTDLVLCYNQQDDRYMLTDDGFVVRVSHDHVTVGGVIVHQPPAQPQEA